MTLSRRLFLAAPLALAACAALPADPAPGAFVPVTLDGAFTGRSIGAGVFRDITGTERRFTARLDGRLAGDRLTVVEDFVYDDGQVDRLTWVFDRDGPGRWTGRREDTVGPATVVEDGGLVRLSYTVDFRSPGGITRLGFADVIYGLPDGRIANDAVVTRFGIPVGRVRFELVRR